MYRYIQVVYSKCIQLNTSPLVPIITIKKYFLLKTRVTQKFEYTIGRTFLLIMRLQRVLPDLPTFADRRARKEILK